MLKRYSLLTALGAFVLMAAVSLPAQQKGKKLEGVLVGPGTGKLGDISQVEVPEGYIFLDGKSTRTRLEAGGNSVSGNELGSLFSTNSDWAVFFEFDDLGYVKDAEKQKLDANELLDGYKKGTAYQNKEREKIGLPPLVIVGWEQEPKYDPTTQNLTWAIRATSGGEPILNYNTRILGRKGVMEVVVACDPKDFPKILPSFNRLLATHKFASGESYAEYKPGDKVAKYGLAALVLGGAAVGAAKMGWLAALWPVLKKIWIFIVAAVVGVAKFFKGIFYKITGKKDEYRLED